MARLQTHQVSVLLLPKVVCHNLHNMAPFYFSRAGFCMVFRRASFVFHAQGQIFEPRIGFWISRSTFWPGDLFGPKKWSRKNMFCGGMILWWGFRGIPPAQMNSMVPGTHMGRLLCPKPSLFNYFVGISSFPGKLQVAPVPSLLSLVGPLAAYFPLVGTLGCQKRLPYWRT